MRNYRVVILCIKLSTFWNFVNASLSTIYSKYSLMRSVYCWTVSLCNFSLQTVSAQVIVETDFLLYFCFRIYLGFYQTCSFYPLLVQLYCNVSIHSFTKGHRSRIFTIRFFLVKCASILEVSIVWSGNKVSWFNFQ